jgi:hypothetical protein
VQLLYEAQDMESVASLALGLADAGSLPGLLALCAVGTDAARQGRVSAFHVS